MIFIFGFLKLRVRLISITYKAYYLSDISTWHRWQRLDSTIPISLHWAEWAKTVRSNNSSPSDSAGLFYLGQSFRFGKKYDSVELRRDSKERLLRRSINQSYEINWGAHVSNKLIWTFELKNNREPKEKGIVSEQITWGVDSGNSWRCGAYTSRRKGSRKKCRNSGVS